MEGHPAVEWGLLGAGILLIVVGAAFVWVLPEEAAQVPQFMVRFVESTHEVTVPDTALTEGENTIPFDVPRGNLTRLEALLELTDDQAASNPDRLKVEVLSPTGEIVGTVVEAATELGQLDEAMPPAYQAQARMVAITILVHDRPSALVVDALTPSESAQQVATRVAANASLPGQGAWNLRLTLDAGDCPSPDIDPPRSAACRSAQPDGVDGGNPVKVVQVRSFHFDAVVEARDA